MRAMLRGITAAAAFAVVALGAISAFAQGICPNNLQPKVITTTSYTILAADFCNVLVFTSGSSIAVALPGPGTNGSFYANWSTSLFAAGAGTITITPGVPPAGGSAPTINGSTTVTITTGNSRKIVYGSDAKWYAPPGA